MIRIPQPAKVLTIGGSDSGGAAGIQADLKTFTIFGVYGMSVLTVATAQNSLEVVDTRQMDADFVSSQLDAVLSDYGADGVKTGFIGNADLIKVIASKISEYMLKNTVIDPVLVNHRGQSMFSPAVTEAYVQYLLPLAALVTPNVREAELITGVELAGKDSFSSAAEQILASGASSVLITGRRAGDQVMDYFHDGSKLVEYRSPWIDTPNRHGSGDALSASICALLALNLPLAQAIEEARVFTAQAVEGGSQWRLGAGHGPIDIRRGSPAKSKPNSANRHWPP